MGVFMMKLYMVRHGETDLNQSRVYFGWQDVSINEAGREQAKILKEKLSDITFSSVLASPLQRARQTAAIIKPDIVPVIDEGLKELNFGQWEGMHYTAIAAKYPQEWQAWADDWLQYQIKYGESFAMFYARVKKSFEQLKVKYENQQILLVTHAGVMKIIMLLALDLPMQHYWNFAFDFGKYSVIHLDLQGGAIVKKINN